MKNLIIVGAGGFGRELYSWAQDCIRGGQPWQVKGFLDDNPHSLDHYRYPVKVLGDVASYRPQQDDIFVCSIADIKAKMRCCQALLAKGATFANLLHPTAFIGQNVTLGRGVLLGPHAVLTCDLTLGDFVTVSSHSGVAHDVRIADWCHINGWCTINGQATLEEGVFLASNAIILPGARLGKRAYVGAGSLVLKKVADFEKVFGVPAVGIGQVD